MVLIVYACIPELRNLRQISHDIEACLNSTVMSYFNTAKRKTLKEAFE